MGVGKKEDIRKEGTSESKKEVDVGNKKVPIKLSITFAVMATYHYKQYEYNLNC